MRPLAYGLFLMLCSRCLVAQQVVFEAITPYHSIKVVDRLGMRVLSVNDLGFNVKGGSLFMAYQQQKEKLAALNVGGTLNALGIGGIP